MKTTGKLTRLFAMVLCIAMLALALASCGASNKVVISYTGENGKVYELTEAEYAFLMKYRKYEIFNSYGYPAQWDTSEFWLTDAGDNVTLDATVTSSVLETAKSIVIEKYLMDKYGLSIENDAEAKKTMEQAAKNVKDAVKSLGGAGAYKRYWGYTSQEMVNYTGYVLQSELVSNHLYDDKTGITQLTEEQLDSYYKENYKQYLMILIDTTRDIAKDDDGNIIYICLDQSGKKVEVTDISKENLEKNKYTLAYTYKYEDIKDEARKTEKKELQDVILNELKNGADFKELALKYSDEFLTHHYENGYIVSGDIINDTTAIKAVDALEIGDYTKEAISLESGKFIYIIKRIELTDKAYKHAEEDAEETEYAEIFKTFRTAVKNYEYSELLKEYAKNIWVDSETIKKYKMADTYLSREILYS